MNKQIDELLLLLVLGFVIYSVRRWQKLREEITRRKQIEESLQQKVQIIDQIHDSVISTDLDGYVTSWNKGAERIFGYSAEEAWSRHISFVYPQDQHQFLQDQVIAPLKQKGKHEIEVHMQRKSGEDFYAHLSLSLLKNNFGAATGMIGYAMDITERKRVEEALRESEELFRQLAENIREVFFIRDLEQNLMIYVSPIFEEVWQQSRESLYKNPQAFLDYVVAEDHNRVRAALEKQEQGIYFNEIYRIMRPDGTIRWVWGRAFPIKNDAGTIYRLVGIVEDITERKRAEDELKAQKERLQKIVDNIPVMIVYISPDGETEWVNREWRRVLGWTLEEAQSRNILLEMYPALDDRQAVLDFALQPPSGWRDFRTTIKDGHELDTAWANVLLSDGSSIGIGQDISKRKQTEQEIKRQAMRAETLTRIAARLNKQLELDVVIHAVCEEALDTFNVSQTAMSLYDEKSDLLVYAGGINIAPEYVAVMEPINRAQFEEFVRTMGPTFVISDVQSLQGVPNVELNARQDIRTVVITTMFRDQELIGTITLGVVGHIREFDKAELSLLQAISDQAAQAIANARLFERIQNAREQMHLLSRRLLKVQEAERRHIARELHDEIGQVLTGLKLLIDMSVYLPTDRVESQLSEARQLINELMEQVEELSLNLRPAMLDDLGLLPALLSHFERYRQQTNVQVSFQQTGLEGRRFSSEMEITVFRLIQEALTNVARHARVDAATVRLWVNPNTLGVEIEDQGAGFDPSLQRASTGLSGMRERVDLLGGKLTIDSALEGGTAIIADLPLSDSA